MNGLGLAISPRRRSEGHSRSGDGNTPGDLELERGRGLVSGELCRVHQELHARLDAREIDVDTIEVRIQIHLDCSPESTAAMRSRICTSNSTSTVEPTSTMNRGSSWASRCDERAQPYHLYLIGRQSVTLLKHASNSFLWSERTFFS
jgi:hypothetical protein